MRYHFQGEKDNKLIIYFTLTNKSYNNLFYTIYKKPGADAEMCLPGVGLKAASSAEKISWGSGGRCKPPMGQNFGF